MEIWCFNRQIAIVMRIRYTLLLALLLACGSAYAQSSGAVQGSSKVFSWDPTVTNVKLDPAPDENPVDYQLISPITNLTNDTIYVKWYRNQVMLDGSTITTSICLGLCAAPWVDEAPDPVMLPPHGQNDVVVHFQYDNTSTDSLVVYLRVGALNQSASDTVTARYVGTIMPTSAVRPSVGTQALSMSLYPSALQAGGTMNVVITSASTKEAAVKVYDMLGREVVQSIPAHLMNGKNLLHLSTSGLPAGRYFASLVSGGTRELTKSFEVVK